MGVQGKSKCPLSSSSLSSSILRAPPLREPKAGMPRLHFSAGLGLRVGQGPFPAHLRLRPTCSDLLIGRLGGIA